MNNDKRNYRYTGRITSVSDDIYEYDEDERLAMQVGFISEIEPAGAFISIEYKYSTGKAQYVQYSELYRRLELNKDKVRGIRAEVCLSRPISLDVAEYKGKGLIKLFEEGKE